MFKKIIIISIFLSLFAFSVNAEEISVHGSTTVSTNLLNPKKSEIEKISGHTLNIVSNGSGRGVQDLVDGKAQIAMISAPLEGVAGKLNLDTSNLKDFEVGAAVVAFIVNPANPVKELSLEQVKDILLGKLTNWKELGGEDKNIIIVVESKGGGIRSVVESDLLKKAEISGTTRVIPNATQITKVVGQLTEGFGISTPSSVDSSAVIVKTEKELKQPLILVTNGEPTPTQKAVIDAIKSVAK